MTDSDEAGENIRKQIHSAIQGVYDARIKPNSRKNYFKKGVAEAIKEEIVYALKEHVTSEDVFYEEYDLVILISLSDNPSEKR